MDTRPSSRAASVEMDISEPGEDTNASTKRRLSIERSRSVSEYFELHRNGYPRSKVGDCLVGEVLQVDRCQRPHDHLLSHGQNSEDIEANIGKT